MTREGRVGKQEMGPGNRETVSPEVLEAVNYLKDWKKDLVSNREFSYLRPVLNILTDTLKPDLTTDLNGQYPLFSIYRHALESAGEKVMGLGNAISSYTIKTISELLGQKRLETYWPFSLKVGKENPSSLANRGGVYRIGVRPDKKSDTFGGAEIQQALAAKLLQGAENARVMGNTPTHTEFEALPYPDRKAVSTESQAYLQAAEKGYLTWQKKQKHLTHIKTPVPAKHTNDELIILQGDKFSRRKVLKPNDAQVRVFRSAGNEEFYYADVKIEDVLMQDPEMLGRALISTSEDTSKQKISWDWHKIPRIEDVPNDNDPPSYSISSGIDEKKQTSLQKAVRSGKAIMHCNYDYDILQLEFGHLYKDGAAAKQDAMAVAYATQYGRGDNLVKSRLPKTEILPGYEEFRMPDHDDLQKLLDDMLLAKGEGKPAINFRENYDLRRIVHKLGLQDLRLRFDDFTPDQTKGLAELVKNLNSVFYEPKMKEFENFLSNHPAKQPLSEAGLKVLKSLVAQKFQPQHAAEIATELSIGPIAVNDTPLKKENRLTQRAVPTDTKDAPLFSKRWIERYWTELSLSKFSATSFNILQLGSDGWRKNLLGTENLGKFFSPKLTRKMFVESHFSDIGSFKSKVNDLEVELDYFETARPAMDIEEFMGSALASMTHQEKARTPNDLDKYTVRTTTRETLLPTMQNNLPIDNSDEFKDTLKEVVKDLIPEGQNDLRGRVMLLHTKWLQIKADLAKIKTKKKFALFTQKNDDPTLEGNIILVSLMLEYEQLLRDSPADSPVWKSFQILMAAGVRHLHKLRLENTYNAAT